MIKGISKTRIYITVMHSRTVKSVRNANIWFRNTEAYKYKIAIIDGIAIATIQARCGIPHQDIMMFLNHLVSSNDYIKFSTNGFKKSIKQWIQNMSKYNKILMG